MLLLATLVGQIFVILPAESHDYTSYREPEQLTSSVQWSYKTFGGKKLGRIKWGLLSGYIGFQAFNLLV